MNHAMAAIVLSAFAASLPAAAQGIYRCGNNYSQQPCPGGSEVEAPPAAPSAREQAQSREATRRDAKAAEAMEKARMKEEAKPVSVYLPPVKKEAASEPRPAKTKKTKMPEYFTAVEPGDKNAKKKDEANK